MIDKIDIYPSNRLIERLFRNLPIKYYAYYANVDSDIYFDQDHFTPNSGLNLLDYKLTDDELFTNYPIDWQEYYFDYELLDKDPVLKYGCNTFLSFTWGNLSSGLPKLDSLDLVELIKHSKKFDIHSGLSVPIIMGNKTYGLFTVIIDERCKLSDIEMYAIASFCHNLGIYLVSFEYPTPIKPLPPRTLIKLTESYNSLDQLSALISNNLKLRLNL